MNQITASKSSKYSVLNLESIIISVQKNIVVIAIVCLVGAVSVGSCYYMLDSKERVERAKLLKQKEMLKRDLELIRSIKDPVPVKFK